MPALPKYIIWSPGRGRTHIAPGQTMLRLISDEAQGVRVVACLPDGRRMDSANLLSFRQDGIIMLHSGITTQANMALNEHGQLVAMDPYRNRMNGDTIFTPTLPT